MKQHANDPKSPLKNGHLDDPAPDLSARAARLLPGHHDDALPADCLTLRECLLQWCTEALENRGRLAGLAAVARVVQAYSAMDQQERDLFFRLLYQEFSLDPDEINAAVNTYRAADPADPEPLWKLTLTLESPRLHLFRQFHNIPESLKFLVDLRADLLGRTTIDSRLREVEFDLRHILQSWFTAGFLELRRITWDSPAALLEKLVDYEAVHQIDSWLDLKRRLIADRACFAFIHPSMPGEPIIFVEVALVQGLAGNIQELLDHDTPHLSPNSADTAIFYSITNAQRGLRGIPFGNLLIKLVASQLRSEVPNLRSFATLSPLPRFRSDLLEPALADHSIADFYTREETEELLSVSGCSRVSDAVLRLLDTPSWHRPSRLNRAVRPGLERAAVWYLSSNGPDGRPRCPVARFHGSNGAVLAQVNWQGDTSDAGLTRSAGLMVNYVYDLDHHDQLQQRYGETQTLPLSDEIETVLSSITF